MITVDIDKNSGFCAGVIRAIGKAEEFLKDNNTRLYSLGAIVHNDSELERLMNQGLVTRVLSPSTRRTWTRWLMRREKSC